MRRPRLPPARLLALVAALGSGACVYFNTMYDAGREYDEGLAELRSGSRTIARQHFDSVSAKAGRVVRDHPDSKWADDAAILKTRAELRTEKWESAEASARRARELASDPRSEAVADGLAGIAALELGRLDEADSLLSEALAVEGIAGEDRANFLFNRGVARIRDNRPAEAAEDLRTAARDVELSPEGRLDLALALRRIGAYDEAAAATVSLVMESGSVVDERSLRLHVDSLAREAPAALDAALEAALRDSVVPAARLPALYLYRGIALRNVQRTAEAVVLLDSAVELGPNSRAGSEAALLAAETRIESATDPATIRSTEAGLTRAQGVSEAEARERARRLLLDVRQFDDLMAAAESRGESAAEALLRAAELAGVELHAPVVARGLYLQYLALRPDSPWAGKAIFGALSFSGQQPAEFAGDRGAATDAELRARLDSLPVDDPYRLALEGRERTVRADSAYVRAELDLRRRLDEIRMLYDSTVVRGLASDTLADSLKAVSPAGDSSRAGVVEF